jgi:molybdate transport system substrate-binding protein
MGVAPDASGVVIDVMNSGGFTAASVDLIGDFERTTKNKVVMSFGPSMGIAPDSIPNRIDRGEPVDIVIMVGTALDGLIKKGKVIADSRVDLARSRIGLAVRAGAPKPDIRSVDAFRTALLDAKSIAYSDSASGVYISTVLFQRLGIADQVRSKSREIKSERVGNVVARGEAEIGFQQVSELLPVPGIDFVGPIPDEVQKVTVFSAGIATTAKKPDTAARALVRYFASARAIPAIVRSGLEPMTAGGDASQ